ncbi:MAG: protein translocase subunit SecD [Clostridia bacterium]|nr:protein translocase subunit SecD [Clostridia bacterium]
MKKAKTKARLTLAALLVLTVLLTVLGVTGLPALGLKNWLPTTDAEKWPEALPLGLDLRGGVYVEYSAARPDDGDSDFTMLLETTMSVIRTRLSDKGYSEATVQRLGEDGIRVEIPDVTDTAFVLELIGEPALLEFATPDGVTFMTGEMVSSAQPAPDQSGQPGTVGKYVIHFKLNREGEKLFGDMTTKYVGQVLYILLDGEVLLSPVVNEPITNGTGSISGMDSQEEAAKIASQIQSGALPLVLTQQKIDTVSATLGDDALSTSVMAALIGMAVIMALMCWRYRMNGIVASWALVIYIVLLFLVIYLVPGIQLTLSGLAGIVLGIGMAVDANVIIFERFNEEVRKGRSLKAAVRAGFKNAAGAVLDGNITTLIAAGVLLVFGTGTIRGFGMTLGLSVLASMFTAVFVTRLIMLNLVQVRRWKPAAFTYGEIKKEEEGV